MKKQVSQLLTAPAGAGKSYMVTWDLVERWLPNTTGPVITNMPYGLVPESHSSPPQFEGETFAQRIGEYVAAKHGGDPLEYESRIQLISNDVLEAWKTGEETPLETFQDTDITGALIIIDEAHNYIGRGSEFRHCKTRWQKFCGELRHQGGCIQFVTQTPGKLAKEIIDECGVRQALVDSEEERDPIFGIQLYYWYQLKAKIFGRYNSCFVRIDMRDIDGKKNKHDNVERVTRKQEIFALYDSFAAPIAGGVAASAGVEKKEWELRSWPRFLLWFFYANPWKLAKPFLIAGLLITVMLNGKTIFGSFVGAIQYGATGVPPAAPEGVPSSYTSTNIPEDNQVQADAVAKLEEEKQQLLQRIEEAESKLRKLSVLRVVTPNSVTTADGQTYRVGETILYGDLVGRRVASVDFARRACKLDNGVWVFLGENQETGGPRVGPPVSTPSDRVDEQENGVPLYEDGHPVGGRSADRGFAPSDFGGLGVVGGDRGEPRPGFHIVGSDETTGGPGHSGDSPEAWNGSHEDRGAVLHWRPATGRPWRAGSIRRVSGHSETPVYSRAVHLRTW